MGSRMYSDYFGIRENAFSITPDPRYLYMSERHREAFAHLLYGAVESGGFVQLTGEVGTGKTTICRAFLEQLPDNVDVALLLNPPDTPRQLLLAIISELHIPLRTPTAPLKALVDRLNASLLENHSNGRRTVVIIDEAQTIKTEVLEQVRLLTNLETPSAKLLQVFLIGQPELREQLERVSLRQVAQRITARYHLEPLTRQETEDYIRHRLAVAGCRQGLFNAKALSQVYQESQGIPRVINILCDRALLGAFATDKTQVDAALVRYAARQWRGGSPSRRAGAPDLAPMLGVTAAVLLSTAAVVFAFSNDFRPQAATVAPAAAPTAQNGTAPPHSEPLPQEPAEPQLNETAAVAAEQADVPGDMVPVWPVQPSGGAGQRMAEQIVLRRWHAGTTLAEGQRLCDAAPVYGLRCRREVGDLARLRAYNRPAVVTLVQADGTPDYAALTAIDAQQITLQMGETTLQVTTDELSRYWSGEFVLLWAPPLENVPLIGPGAPEHAVLWLRQALDRVEGAVPAERYRRHFDGALQNRLRRFQVQHGLLADGVAGMQTLTHLSNLLGETRSPQLTASDPLS